MPKRKTTKKASKKTKKKTNKEYLRCYCGADCHDEHAHLPGYLLIALGLLALPINLGFIPGLEWAKAWPLLLVLFGFVLLAKVSICRMKSK